MRTSVAVLGVSVLAAAAFVAGAYMGSVRGWGTGTVTARLVNESGRPIRALTIEFRSCGAQGVAVAGSLEPGETRMVRYTVCGEASYSVRAAFEDGRVLQGREGYVETGYRSVDVISANAISSVQHFY